jgi:hypothetical protein
MIGVYSKNFTKSTPQPPGRKDLSLNSTADSIGTPVGDLEIDICWTEEEVTKQTCLLCILTSCELKSYEQYVALACNKLNDNAQDWRKQKTIFPNNR